MTEQIISQEGYEKLKKELDHLTKVKRLEIAQRIERAKELGDLSENAEYAEAKEEQAFNEGRVIEIASILKNVTIVGQTNGHEIGMGSTIMVKSNGVEKTYTIVSFNEADPGSGKISNESPLGLAFLGRKKGDKVNINTPRGIVEYQILKIE